MTARSTNQACRSTYSKVKVDAPVSGYQITNYRRHAVGRLPLPIVIALGRTRVSPCAPSLKWSNIVDAIALVTKPHHAWLSLREFLLDEKIVRAPIPREPVDAAAFIDVIVHVNRRIGDLWPKAVMVWQSGALRNSLRDSVAAHRDLITTGGPLRYGLSPTGDSWEWSLAVATRNAQSVRITAEQLLRDAHVGGLPLDWLRHKDRPEVLERRRPLGPSHDELVAWFDEGLRQLRNVKVLERYLAGVAAKQGTSVAPELPNEIEA